MVSRNMVLILMAAILIVPTVHSQSVSLGVNQISPQPVEPGNDLNLQISYTNFGNTPINNLMAALDLRYPFTLTSETDNFENGINICSFCSRTNSYIIHVDQLATSGIYQIYIRLNSTQSEAVKTRNVSVTGKPNIILYSEPVNNVVPAAPFNLILDISNIGTGAAKQIKVVSKSSDFVALGGSAISIDVVNARNNASVSFSMSANSDLTASSYNLPFEINYKDEQGNSYNTTQNIGVQVVNSGKLNIEDIKTAADNGGGKPLAGSPMTVIVRLQNIGHGNANAIRAQLTCDNKNATAFLGQLKSEEDAPAVFSLTAPAGGTHDCTLVTNYQDDLGNHSITSNISIAVASPEFPMSSIIILIIIIALIVYFLRRRRKKK